MKSLKQKRYFDSREFYLNDDYINVKFKNLKKTNEVGIDYDYVTGKKQRIVDGSVTTYVIFRISFILVTLSFLGVQFTDKITSTHIGIFAIIGFTALIIYYFSRNDFLKIDVSDNEYIYMHRKIPNESEVEKFVDNLMEKRNEYLKKKHLSFDKLLPYEEQHKNLRKLVDFKVINQTEFEDEESKLKRLFGNINEPKQKIGFR